MEQWAADGQASRASQPSSVPLQTRGVAPSQLGSPATQERARQRGSGSATHWAVPQSSTVRQVGPSAEVRKHACTWEPEHRTWPNSQLSSDATSVTGPSEPPGGAGAAATSPVSTTTSPSTSAHAMPNAPHTKMSAEWIPTRKAFQLFTTPLPVLVPLPSQLGSAELRGDAHSEPYTTRLRRPNPHAPRACRCAFASIPSRAQPKP
jgi:hypothetical protein